MSALAWVSWTAVGVVIGLGGGLVAWVVRNRRRQRRRARILAVAEARYRQRPAPRRHELEAGTGLVSVADLVARIRAEGGATRLNWDDLADDRPENDSPTAVLPRVRRADRPP